MITLGAQEPLRIAVPFMQSMHVTMLRFLVSQLGGDADEVLDFIISPPSEAEDLLRSGRVDAFMIGAPWATNAVENGSGHLMLTSNSIWQGAPEKALGVRHDWLEKNTETACALVRAIYRAGAWIAHSTNIPVLGEILSRREYLDLNAGVIEPHLNGEIMVDPLGGLMRDPFALRFDPKEVGFPWKSSAAWIAEQNARYLGVDAQVARETARDICRTDIFRKALESMRVSLPQANEKIEGSLPAPTSVSWANDLVLGPDAFFDGSIFDVD